jgi:hypothetical protein
MTYLLFTVALSLSALAAYYAVMGLIAIFAAAVVPIALMGSLLEASKLVVASWLYRNWKKIPKLMKWYFTAALFVLMMLTSMGIFGFLSKAHLDQAVPTGDVAAKLAIIDEKIKTEKENINASRKELSQLDSQVDQTVARTTDANGAERAIAIRRGQQKDRARILKEIGEAQTKVAKLNEERAPIASEVRKVEAEVGPIKYIAALIYGDNVDENMLEKSVRIVTIMIVIVFDPLAVLLLIAANWQKRRDEEDSEQETKPDWTEFMAKPPVEDFPEKEEPHPLQAFFDKNKELNLTEPRPISDFPELQEAIKQGIEDGTLEIKGEDAPKEILIEDDVQIVEPSVTVEVTPAEPTESEIPEIQVDEQTKDWEPQLYERRELGRYQREMGHKPSKTTSFLNKVQSVFKSKTIEAEVEELQDKK